MPRQEKKPVHKVVMTEGKRDIIRGLLSEYDIESAEDIQDALKDLLGGTIKEMMEAEMDNHLGYEKSERSSNENSRNGYKQKRINSSYGFETSEGFISDVTDKILPQIEEWQNRLLDDIYPIVFIDATIHIILIIRIIVKCCHMKYNIVKSFATF